MSASLRQWFHARALLGLALMLGTMSACSGATGSSGPTLVQAPPRALTDYAPADPLWVVQLSPSALLALAEERPGWQRMLDVMLPLEQRRGFERLFVVRPEEVSSALVARVSAPDLADTADNAGAGGAARESATDPFRFVALVRGDFPARDVVRSIGMRMNTVEVESDSPVRRVGFLGDERREVLEVDDHTYGYSGGAGPAMASLASIASGANEDPAQPEPGAAKLVVLERLLGDSPFRFLVPRPLALPVDTPLGMVLARQETFGLSVSPAPQPGKVQLRLALTGEFPSTIEANGRQLLGSFFASDLGRALVGDHAPSVRVETREQSVLVSVELDTDKLATGLQYIFTVGVSDLL